MSNLEDFRRKLQGRPQELRAQKEAEIIQEKQAAAARQQQEEMKRSQEETNKSKRQKIELGVIEFAYQNLGIQSRLEVMAQQIKGGHIVKTIHAADIGLSIDFDIPYHTFLGREFVKAGATSHTGYKPTGKKQLSETIGVSLSLHKGIQNNYAEIGLTFLRKYFEPRKLYPEPKWFQFINPTIYAQGCSAQGFNSIFDTINQTVRTETDAAFIEQLDKNLLGLYDGYLKATKQL